MPSLVLTGHPLAGKTAFARLLAARAHLHPSGAVSNVVHITDAAACPDRSKAECYADSAAEKTTRAALKAAFDRAVVAGSDEKGGGSTLVILDSLNYIKGYRYELYCISKAAGERHGVVWIAGGDEGTAKERNRKRKELSTKKSEELANAEEDGYFEDDATMDALVLRYEPPDDKNRWEKPLYKVDVTTVLPWGKEGTLASSTENANDDKNDALSSQTKAMKVEDAASAPPKPAKKSASGFKRRGKKSTQQRLVPQSESVTPAPEAPSNVPSSIASRNLQSASSDPSKEPANGAKQKMEDVIDHILDSFLLNVAPLTEGMSTLQHVSAESNALNLMDSLTHRVNADILNAQKAASLSAGMGGRIFVSLSSGEDGRRAVDLPKPLYANELRTFRRQFLKWIAGHPMPDGTGEGAMAEAYISYIESHI
ncbi:hypothetical protein ACHAXT_005462 [Thalassiosira profunda]